MCISVSAKDADRKVKAAEGAVLGEIEVTCSFPKHFTPYSLVAPEVLFSLSVQEYV